MDSNSLYYVIFVTTYCYGCGQQYQKLTNIDYKSYLDNKGNIRYKEIHVKPYLEDSRKAPYYPNYKDSYYKFKTYEEAYNKAVELIKEGVLPNLPISDKIAEYGNIKGVISILKRPLGDVIGYRYAKWVEANQDQIISNKPKFNYGDIVYLTNIEDGDIIYKTEVIDCELDAQNEWQYYTTYWSDYPYSGRGIISEEEFNKLIETKSSGNKYLNGQRVKIVEC